MKKKCPIVKEECWEHACQFYTHLMGKNPQTGVDQDDFGCAISFLPILLVENANVMRMSQASTDKVATEVAKHHFSFLSAIEKSTSQKLELESKEKSYGI